LALPRSALTQPERVPLLDADPDRPRDPQGGGGHHEPKPEGTGPLAGGRETLLFRPVPVPGSTAPRSQHPPRPRQTTPSRQPPSPHPASGESRHTGGLSRHPPRPDTSGPDTRSQHSPGPDTGRLVTPPAARPRHPRPDTPVPTPRARSRQRGAERTVGRASLVSGRATDNGWP
jgi:hypothetical protein